MGRGANNLFWSLLVGRHHDQNISDCTNEGRHAMVTNRCFYYLFQHTIYRAWLARFKLLFDNKYELIQIPSRKHLFACLCSQTSSSCCLHSKVLHQNVGLWYRMILSNCTMANNNNNDKACYTNSDEYFNSPLSLSYSNSGAFHGLSPFLVSV